MNKKKKLFFLLAIIIMFVSQAFSETEMVRDRTLDVIDIPTAEVLDHYGYQVGFRFGKDGNLQNKTIFGIFPRLNLGFGLDGEQIIGTGDARLNKPTINLKFRLFDGRGFIPAFAIGYDGQGYVFNKQEDEYNQKEKGFYLVASKDVFVPDWMLHAGVNKFDFDKSNTTRAFVGTTYTYEHLIGALLEYDHATVYKERRINFGLKYFVTPLFTIEALGRNVPKQVGSSSRETERVVRLVYRGAF